MRHLAFAGGTAIALALAAVPAQAQTNSPSSVTPPSGRPQIPTDDSSVAVPEAEALRAPANAETLSITVRAIEVSDGLPELAAATARITAPFVNRPVTLAELYGAAAAIEQLYAARGYVLTRVVVPPQEMKPGGVFELKIVNGFIETIEVSSSLGNAQRAVAARVRPIESQPGLRMPAIERAILIAGDTPGVTLTSTLAPGTEAGGTRLVLEGRYRPVTGAIAFDNRISSGLGGSIVSAQLALNSPLGLGAQFYGFGVGTTRVSRLFGSDAPIRILGGGVLVPIGSGRLTLNPEATFTRTQPLPVAGVPDTRGHFRRYSLIADYVIDRTRRSNLVLSGKIEHIEETNDAIGFGVRLSEDRFLVGRVLLDGAWRLPEGGLFAGSVRISQGLDGRLPSELAAGVTPSRQGARPAFTTAAATLRADLPLGRRAEAHVIVKGQTSFGDAVFRSEQASLEGRDALSAYIGGETSVDSAATARLELAAQLRGFKGSIALPYAFVAGGVGVIERPTAIERRELRLANIGLGARVQYDRIGLALEWAHGFAGSGFPRTDRISIAATLGF